MDIKGKLKFKRVINSILRDYSNETEEENAVLIQGGLKRLEKETELLVNVDLTGRFASYLE